jgi:hypothetical protein
MIFLSYVSCVKKEGDALAHDSDATLIMHISPHFFTFHVNTEAYLRNENMKHTLMVC